MDINDIVEKIVDRVDISGLDLVETVDHGGELKAKVDDGVGINVEEVVDNTVVNVSKSILFATEVEEDDLVEADVDIEVVDTIWEGWALSICKKRFLACRVKAEE